ncbi:hypothetical protein K2173_026574 [Erythroxylum novogranatense]|uniref:Protein LOW PSII ACCUMULATION 2, chloroplastic n=1 Tax=Erythroxylum novogranatense TaxID=1862640 RepID=A0AAV8TWH2_9ROSI|nr:hypothetical protein K2173_026574 [Erythroxylum novogranatense]
MALRIPSPPSLLFNAHYHYLRYTPLLLSTSKTTLTIYSQKPTTDAQPAGDQAPTKKPTGAGLGFGSSSSSSSSSTQTQSSSSKMKQKGKRERARIIRRSPVEKPELLSQVDEAKVEAERKNENAFVLAWLGFGIVILVEGIMLAASGFLPEEWDKFFVKYLYPVFTPTVFVFVGGTVAYGVLKYLQNDNVKDQK